MAIDESTIEMDGTGKLVRPSLHDGSVGGIVLDEGEARVLLLDAERRRYALRLQGLERLLVNDMREGNIVLDVVVRPCSRDDAEMIAALIGMKPSDRDHEAVLGWIDRAREESMLVVEINPSYGCHLTALCRDVKVDTW